MAGAWVFVCGPSGAGKDSVIGWARTQLASDPQVVFAQRLLTRPGETADGQRSLDPTAFQALARSGGLAWQWQAHGWHYGIERQHADAVARGRVVVVNGSREHVAGLRHDPSVHLVLVVAPASQLAARQAERGRDGPAAIAARLARNAPLADLPAGCTITNDGVLAEAGRQLVDFLRTVN